MYLDIDHENDQYDKVLLIEEQDENDIEETFFSPLKSTPGNCILYIVFESN